MEQKAYKDNKVEKNLKQIEKGIETNSINSKNSNIEKKIDNTFQKDDTIM